MELGHLPFRKATFEDYVGERGLERLGHKRWRKAVLDDDRASDRRAAARLRRPRRRQRERLGELPPNCRLGHNEDAFLGGFRLWVEETKVARTVAIVAAAADLELEVEEVGDSAT